MPKPEACAWILENVPSGAKILDVGAVNGWELPGYTIDAVEPWEPTALSCAPLYSRVFHKEPAFDCGFYDVICVNLDVDTDYKDRCKNVFPVKKRRGRKK